MIRLVTLAMLLLFSALNPVLAQGGLPAVTVTPQADGGETWTLSIQVLVGMTLLTVLPSLLMVTSGFARILIVLGLLRQALGTGQTPSNQILVGLALLMAAFVMQPTYERVWTTSLSPYLDGELTMEPALEKGAAPIREFMMAQTRESDLMFYAQLAGDGKYETVADVPMHVMAASFLTSELKTAFQIGFLLFIPFVVIDLVVASVLMSMGMMMLSPMLISLPFKILLFTLIDGWSLVLGSIAQSFRP